MEKSGLRNAVTRPGYVYIMDFELVVTLWVGKTHGVHFGKALCMDEGSCRKKYRTQARNLDSGNISSCIFIYRPIVSQGL